MREIDFFKDKSGINKNIKFKQIRKFRRKEKLSEFADNKEYDLMFGSVWGIHDSRILFDSERKKEHFKNSLRPCVALESPTIIDDNKVANFAPGTSSYDAEGINSGKILIASVPPENLYNTTYFKLKFRQALKQKYFEIKFCDLSFGLSDELRKKM